MRLSARDVASKRGSSLSENVKPTLEELVSEAKAGSAEAEREVILELYGDVHRIAANSFSEGLETEDLEQEGLIGLMEAIRDYDPAKNSSFRPFALLCIRRQIQTAQKRALSKNNEPLNRSVSIDADSEETNYEFESLLSEFETNPEWIIMESDAQKKILAVIEDTLSPLERQVVYLRMQGYEAKDQARILNRSLKTIDNATQRVRKKLSEKL